MSLTIFPKKPVTNNYAIQSYSQEGEDCVLARIFGDRPPGLFVDVGAHHPQRFSNTYKFYLQGWRGINIDATPGSMELFKKYRPEDINIEAPISDTEEELTFYLFNEPALNTFSRELAVERGHLPEYQVSREIVIQTRRLADVLSQYLSDKQKIQFFSIDAEGYDFKILKSNDWTRFRPEFVLFEGDPFYSQFCRSATYSFMIEQGYEFVAKTVSTYFFREIKN